MSGKDGGRVSEETRQEILRVAAELGYHPNPVARSLRLGESRSIALVVANIGHPLFAAVLRGVERTARQSNYTVMVIDVMNDPMWLRWVPSLLTAQAIAGCIVYIGDHLSEGDVAALGPNVVLIEGESVNASFVQVNVRAAAEDAMRHLVNLGHRHIGYLAVDLPRESFALREQAYHAVSAEHGLPFDPSYIQATSFDVDRAVATAHTLLTLPQRPTAIFCADDLLAAITYKAAWQLGLRIPQDLSVVGFDDLDLARILEPELTTVSLPGERLGQEAMRLMQQHFDQPAQYTHPLLLELIVRGSTAPPS
jgi:LacI family transcriptional regulator/LacI family repressor for deo operon, udp, cdd, tsx, nupC, and nupG